MEIKIDDLKSQLDQLTQIIELRNKELANKDKVVEELEYKIFEQQKDIEKAELDLWEEKCGQDDIETCIQELRAENHKLYELNQQLQTRINSL